MKRSSLIQLVLGIILVLAGVFYMGYVFLSLDPQSSDITKVSAIALAPVAAGVILINISFIRWGKRPDEPEQEPGSD
ncbi:MAG: hypothetical protein QNK37_27395 [Acidobacteriota bacterium]|nr:hypothetical protein [Acidobacteriota bacterium]